jgi:hypothetical protein
MTVAEQTEHQHARRRHAADRDDGLALGADGL